MNQLIIILQAFNVICESLMLNNMNSILNDNHSISNRKNENNMSAFKVFGIDKLIVDISDEFMIQEYKRGS